MGRRKKEPEAVHRKAIADAAERLFGQKEISATTVDEIAREAGYSKATIYVYFKNKEEIIAYLVLRSMELLLDRLTAAVSGPGNTREKYDAICHALLLYQERYPFYFSLVLGEIKAKRDDPNGTPIQQETFEAGEQINRALSSFLQEGIRTGALRAGLPVLPTVFLFWASLSGLILMADNKREYLEQTLGQSKQEFLQYGFDTLYQSICTQEEK